MKSRIVLAVALAVLAARCSVNNKARAYVNYDQIANFHEYLLSPDASTTHGAGNGMFILVKVTQINNSGAEAKTFVFDANKVSTVTSDQTANDTVLSANILLGVHHLTTVTVPAGQVVNVNKCFIKNALTNNPGALVSSPVGLIYAGTTGQPVTMHNIDPGGSIAAVGNALPNPLQNLCSGN